MDWGERAKLVEALQDGVPAGGDGTFFNRQAELKALLARLARPPSRVLVTVGPIDCGKSKLLKRLKQIWLSNEELAATSPLFYFDLRKKVWSRPQDAAAHVQKAFWSWADRLKSWASKIKQGASAFTLSKGGPVGVDIALRALSELLPASGNTSDLAKVMEAFCGMVDSSIVTYPIFVLDEVGKLKKWDKEDLLTFTGFFKSMVKQDNQAYLILSSSDDFFRVWLRDMFTPGQWEPFGVGYFPEAEARRFFVGHCIMAAGGELPDNLQDSDWNDIYAVCGGSPLLLNFCAEEAVLNSISWKDAADALMAGSLSVVEAGLMATKADMGFSGDNYEKICREIVRAGFICLKAVLANIYSRDKEMCKAEILAMLSGNFVHMRYVTAITRYGDVSVADTGGNADLIMARTPADRAAMKNVLGLLSSNLGRGLS